LFTVCKQPLGCLQGQKKNELLRFSSTRNRTRSHQNWVPRGWIRV